ncbi:Endonuclease/exonuclease/phosphatase [Oceanithermus profundus DSM 14977]|uniref:Endonuclease/exonuclease/phosphatase n=1 Tax=Oceanithermus profundus (strain DSM 14977 / NBRC 100410 / VKM B-2274 / 506) TaxID=670487 RepID=E4UAF5_OCEP5|nr:Endonuclease/exonuclease/phosphatase [Oceanithermus profundus DSM 14977]
MLAACGPKPGQSPPGNPNPPGGGASPPAPETTVEIGRGGGTIRTENAELAIPENAVYGDRPAKITLKDLPLDAPGPVPPEATLIAAAEVWRHNPFTGENAELQNLLIYPATLRLSLKQAVAPAKNSTHYTEVCSWIGEEGDSVGDKNYWFCHLSDIGPGTEEKGQGYIEVQITGLDSRHQNYYVFQFPKVWANQNCVEAGGRINPNIPAIDFHSFSGACRGRPGGTVSQIGELKAPEETKLSFGERVEPQGGRSLRVLTWNVGQRTKQCFYKLCSENTIRKIIRRLYVNQPGIVTFQEMMVEDTYCARPPPNKDKRVGDFCEIDNGFAPVEPRVINTILAEWERLDPSVQLDYYCEQYECTIVNTAAFTFADPDKRQYLTGGAADTGYLYTQLLSSVDGFALDLYNAHLASPSSASNNLVRARQINELTDRLRGLRSSNGSASVLVIGDHNLCIDCQKHEGRPEPDDLAISDQVALINTPDIGGTTWYDDHDLDAYPSLLVDSQVAEGKKPSILHMATSDFLVTGGLVLHGMIDFPLSNRFYGSCAYAKDPRTGRPSKTVSPGNLTGMDHNALICELRDFGTSSVNVVPTTCGIPTSFTKGTRLFVAGMGLTAKFDPGKPYRFDASLFEVASTEASTWYGFEKVDDFTYAVEIPSVFIPNALIPSSSSTPPVVFVCPEGDLSRCRVAEVKNNEKYVFVELAEPGQCTINYLLAADAGWGAVPEGDFDFVGLPDPYPDDQESGMTYELVLPDWLRLEPAAGTLQPGQRFTEVIDVESAQAFCDGAVEKEGKIRVRTQNPELEFEVPVRLMCAELDVRFEPESYNGGLPNVEPEKRCGRITGTVTVRGADHLREMYAYDVYDGEGNYIETKYDEPLFDFIVEHANYTSHRFPWVGVHDLHRPDEANDWDWSSFPEVPFFSWTSSCAFDEGLHQVNSFYLVHPKVQQGYTRVERMASRLSAPLSFTIHDNRFPGAVYNSARYCVPDGNGGEVCTEANALVQISTTGDIDQAIPLDYRAWQFALHPFAEVFFEGAELRDDEGNLLATMNYDFDAFIPPDQIRYCRIGQGNAFFRSDETFFGVDGVPPVYWTQNIELHRAGDGSLVPYLIEGVFGWECYPSWDVAVGSADQQTLELRRGELQPLGASEPVLQRGPEKWPGGFMRFNQRGAGSP